LGRAPIPILGGVKAETQLAFAERKIEINEEKTE
jgi:hypothetical protein